MTSRRTTSLRSMSRCGANSSRGRSIVSRLRPNSVLYPLPIRVEDIETTLGHFGMALEKITNPMKVALKL